MRRQIALLTDFGTADHYVAAMKGVIAARCEAQVHDLTHDIEAFDVFAAAWFLRNVAEWWPAGTIFVCVVDPGVGTARQIIAVERDGRIFLTPDNGLLTFIDSPAARRFAVTNESLFLPASSNTFHGRDRFAPVAAALASGIALESVGPALGSIQHLSYEAPVYAAEEVRGTIVAIDRFGNAVTDIEAARVPFVFAARTGSRTIDRLERNYGDAAPGPFLIVGSSGLVEISVANGNAASELGLRRGDGVVLTRRS